jgi:hypothetical protein
MLKTDFIRAVFRRPVKPPPWWEGHVIHYKEYLPDVKPQTGICTLNLSSRDAGQQRLAPYIPGQFLTVSVGGKRMRGQVSDIDIYRPGWADSHSLKENTFDPDKDSGEWLIELTFPHIPVSDSES